MEGRCRGAARRREASSLTRGGEGAGGLAPGCDTCSVVWSAGVRGGHAVGSRHLQTAQMSCLVLSMCEISDLFTKLPGLMQALLRLVSFLFFFEFIDGLLCQIGSFFNKK